MAAIASLKILFFAELRGQFCQPDMLTLTVGFWQLMLLVTPLDSGVEVRWQTVISHIVMATLRKAGYTLFRILGLSLPVLGAAVEDALHL